MTDLTEQWKKGKLAEGHYYVKDGENMIAELLDGYFYNDGQPMTSFSGGVDEVLAPVPSYDGYMTLIRAYNDVVDENTQLKELLKEFQTYISEWDTPMDILARIDEVLGEKE